MPATWDAGARVRSADRKVLTRADARGEAGVGGVGGAPSFNALASPSIWSGVAVAFIRMKVSTCTSACPLSQSRRQAGAIWSASGTSMKVCTRTGTLSVILAATEGRRRSRGSVGCSICQSTRVVHSAAVSGRIDWSSRHGPLSRSSPPRQGGTGDQFARHRLGNPRVPRAVMPACIAIPSWP